MSDKADTLEDNPFAYLFPSLEEAKKYSREAAAKLLKEKINPNSRLSEAEASTSVCDDSDQTSKNSLNVQKDDGKAIPKRDPLSREERINNIIERVFGFTFNENTDKQLLCLAEFASDNTSKLIDLSELEQILFERLLLENPSKYLLNVPANGIVDSNTVETEVITYLMECHKKLNALALNRKNDDIRLQMQMLILRNATTALRQPDLYENQNLNEQVLEIFYDRHEMSSRDIRSFFNGIVNELIKNEENAPEVILTTFSPVFDFVHKKVANSNLINFEHAVVFPFLHLLSYNEHLAEALIDHSTPTVNTPGKVFADTLIGAVFCLSCLPKVSDGPYEFFDNIDIHSVKTTEDTVWTSLSCISDNLHLFFLTLLKTSPKVRHKTLEWLADCLQSNSGRGKIGGMSFMSMFEEGLLSDFGGQNVSDAFMLNLTAVLLRLCQPFVSNFDSPKILKIDPTYCAATVSSREEAHRRNRHMHNLNLETCLLPVEEGVERPSSENFNFITECYFLAQKSLDLGFRICVEKVNKLVEELTRMQRAYNDAAASRGANHEVTEHIQERMHLISTRYLSVRAALIEPKTLSLLVKLHATSANWLIQILLNADDPNSSHILRSMKPLVIPLPEETPITLRCVPEFILLNMTCFLSFIKRFNKRCFEENGFEWMEPILSVIVLFMGSSKRISNPHLRAGLAEAMEALLPNNNDDDLSINPNPMGTICRSQLFKQHPLAKLIIPSLLDLFVSIEMTGRSVQFEEKFNYRRPMYVVMDYLWYSEVHRNSFKELALEAEKSMEAVTPPLFLRFLNLLINDAVFLLDEALTTMAQLKTMQVARESGEWAKLPAHERAQNESHFFQAGMHAKFDNILGRWTIHTLEYLTSEITSIFLHPVMVDRVAAMLNYFLHNLVGPNKKNFKVKDKEEYDFKPDVFVMDICKIYVHLYHSDAFCLAISQDGRSYNAELFSQAQDVLARIGGGALIGDLKLVDDKVSFMASRQKLEEEMLPEAPEEFLDPIMSTLMTDPVILPSSRQIVDRNTIARHLLSDETDPFNRSPLTLDKVKSHEELRARIEKWMKERKKQVQALEEKMASTSSAQNQEDSK